MTFRDVTSEAGVHHVYENGAAAGRNAILESLGGGAAVADTDRDGRPDLLFASGGRFEGDGLVGLPTSLFRQVGEGTFADVTAPAGLGDPGRYSHGCAAADADGDGFIDLLVTGYGGVRFWRNMGDGTWDDRTEATGLTDDSWSSSAGWGDVDSDGDLDLYVAHYVNWSFENDPRCDGPSGVRDVCPPRAFDGLDDVLFLSNGDGTFRDATKETGLARGGKGLGVVLVDIDLDGDLDIYVANDTTNNFLYVNDGRGHFEERGMAAGVAVDDQANANGSMGIAAADYDADGAPDLFVANYEDELFALYRNDGGGNFLYASTEAGLRALTTVYVGFGCVAGDFDLDGDEDLAVANGHVVHHPRNAPLLQKPLLLLNDGGKFEDVSGRAGPYFSSAHAGRGLAGGDLDRDGDLDLVFINSREPAAVLLDETQTPGRSLVVRLVGSESNRDGIGARAVLTTDRGRRSKYMAGGGSYLCTSELALYFAIRPDEAVRELTVFWPNGRVDRVAGDRITHGSAERRVLLVREDGRVLTEGGPPGKPPSPVSSPAARAAPAGSSAGGGNGTSPAR